MRRIRIRQAVLALLTAFSSAWYLLSVSAILLVSVNISRYRELRSRKFWFFVALFSFLPFALIRETPAFFTSVNMLMRALIVYNAFFLLFDNIDQEKFQKTLSKVVSGDLSASLSIALNLLPVIRRSFIQSHGLFYLRTGFMRYRFARYMRFFQAVIHQSVNTADKVAENIYIMEEPAGPQVFIITGKRHSGKTGAALKLVEEYRAMGWPVAGVLAPGFMEDGRRVHIDAMDAATYKRVPLASRNGRVTDALFEYGGFSFSKSGLEFGRRSLMSFKAGSIVMIDEVGPLELEGKGYSDEVRRLLKPGAAAVVLVVREEVLKDILREYSIDRYRIVAASSAAVPALAGP